MKKLNRGNDMKQTLLFFAGLFLVQHSGFANAQVLFVGSGEGAIGNVRQMNAICNQDIEGSHWASTVEYDAEADSRQPDQAIPLYGGTVALRAPKTIFTPDGQAYDQATGALQPKGTQRYPGAVLLRQGSGTFGTTGTKAVPLCRKYYRD